MDMFTTMTPLHAAALYVGLLVVVMLGLKVYVGSQRARHKVASGDVSHPEFGRASRVQLNAVEDVPPLMVGIVVLALINMPAWYIHMTGGVLVAARLAHALGLGSSGGRSIGRMLGTWATILVYFAVGGALIYHAFAPPA